MSAKYTRNQFEGKSTKRRISVDLINKIQSYNDKGCVISLCGPTLLTHYREIRPILRKRSMLLFAEIDNKVIHENHLHRQLRSINDPRVELYCGDIWDGINNLYNRPGWKHKFVFLDLDFCCIGETIIRLGLYNKLNEFARSKLPRKNGFWLALTLCRRGGSDYSLVNIDCSIKKIFMDNGWSIRYGLTLPYAEGGNGIVNKTGTNMIILQYRFKWNYSKNPIK